MGHPKPWPKPAKPDKPFKPAPEPEPKKPPDDDGEYGKEEDT